MRGRRCRCRSPLSAPARKGVGSSWLRWSRPHDDHDGKPFARGSLVRRGAGLIRSGALGQQLAVYCVVRAKHALDDPLTALGLPLIAEFSDTLDEAPNTVTAISNGRNGGFEHWSLVLAFPSGLRATIDLGAGLGAAQSAELDLRGVERQRVRRARRSDQRRRQDHERARDERVVRWSPRLWMPSTHSPTRHA